jgi:DnaJ-domain-containing protein 1
MFGSDERKVYKIKVPVELELDSTVVMKGHMFVSQQQRLSDLMNDERTFLPFEHADGTIDIVHKSMIRRVRPVAVAQTAANSDNPYAILGVQPNATDAEVRDAYHRKVSEIHPDKLAALGLPAEIVKIANERMVRLNQAYARIKVQRRAEQQAAAE